MIQDDDEDVELPRKTGDDVLQHGDDAVRHGDDVRLDEDEEDE